MSHVLICGAAGYTNLGDDAVLWGMMGQLRALLGARPVRVAGGPHLALLAEPWGAAPLGYEDTSELARAIEDADLVILGGGGMLYDIGYEASLARFLGDAPDRQWLYELARIAAAARAAGRPVMGYALGAGPLITESARQIARFIGEQVQVFTVRDSASAELLAECGVPRARLQVAADPAIAVPPAGPDTAQAFLQQAGFAEAPRPWVALNLRPCLGPADETDHLVARCAELVRGLAEDMGASVALLPFQRLYDDDRELLGRVLDAAGRPARAVVVEPPSSPPELVAVLAHFDLMVGMRLHALVASAAAGLPFVGLAYDAKVAEFAEQAGLAAHLHGIERLDPKEVEASCRSLLSRREEVAAALGERREKLVAAAALSAELAAWLLERDAAAPVSRRARAAPSPARGPECVLMQIRADYQEMPGGDTVQMRETRRQLEQLGVAVDVSTDRGCDLSQYDLVHAFNLGRPEDAYHQCLNAISQGKPIALSTVYADFGEMWEWADTDYWELPPPGEGLPRPRRAPPIHPVEARRRAREEALRQAAVDWATVYLPNGQGEAEALHAAYRMDLSRAVVVPNAVAEIFFEARPEAFVARYGLQDFVLCAARVETKKNQLSLVAALRGTGVPLVIIGPPNPEEYRELCRRYADDNVRFLDPLPQDELASAYAAARVHCLPSWFETPGLSTLEAAAAGCNIVSTDRGLAREYLGDLAWYCDPGRVESIKEAVLAAYQAPRSARLKQHVHEHYCWRRAAEETLKGYQLALSLQATRPLEERQAALVAATRRHSEWLARLAADLRYEANFREQQLVGHRELESAYRALEVDRNRVAKELGWWQAELARVTSRRFYRWSTAIARAGWGVLRALGMKR